MTVYWPVKVKCSDCGWIPKKAYYQLVSTSSFCCDDDMPREEQSVPKLCRNCNSKNIESEIVGPNHALKSHHSIEESNTARAIPSFLKPSNE